jgi:hypothetical protein
MQIVKLNNNTYRYTILHFGLDRLYSANAVKKQVAKDLNESKVNLQGQKVVVVSLGEGHAYSTVKHLLDYLAELTGSHSLVRFICCGIDYSVTNLDVHTIPGHMSNHRDFLDKIDESSFQKSIKYKFSCLNRIPKLLRAKLLGSILEHVDRQDICCSYGSFEGPTHITRQHQKYFPTAEIPIYIDNICTTHDDQIAYEAYHSLFNIVSETDSWGDVIFLTEKTFKCFAFDSIPIISSYPGTVAELKKLGFDMFDDIVDHSYDLIEDADARIQAIVEEVKRIDQKYTIAECSVLYTTLLSRLECNKETLQYLSKKSDTKRQQLIQEFCERSL